MVSSYFETNLNDENKKLLVWNSERKCEVRFRPGLPASFDIYKNGKLIVESPRHGFWRLIFFGVVFIFFYELGRGRISIAVLKPIRE